MGSITDSATGIVYRYHYDLTDRLMRYTETGDGYEAIVRYIYNTQNELIQTREIIDGHSRYTVVSYDDDNRIDTWRTGYAKRIYGYDEYGRVVTRNTKHTYGTVSDVMVESYDYLVKNGRETSYVSTYRTDTVGDYDVTYAYTYDANGNITSVTDGENITTYVYDSANQLLREDNQAAGKTWIYTYDNAGNILSKAEYAYTEDNLGNALDTATYTYGNSQWGDLLTGYHGNTITYTANGNPLNDGVWTYSWRHGRQLETMTAVDGSAAWTYSYNKDGLRLSRSNGTTTYNYVYLGGQLKRMTVGNVEIYFSYDSDGSPMSMVYNGTTYYYVKNLQGDVVGIVDKTGVQIASYSYDAWGNPLSVTSNTTANANAATIAQLNPLRYRGYVYDTETGLYYLQSRYYNPEIGRFINTDIYTSTGGLLGNNMFTYCNNNPIVNCDASGTLAYSCFGDSNDHFERPGSGMGSCKANPYDPSALLINGQSEFDKAYDACGLGTYSKNGCAIIAVYNAMLLCGLPQDLDSIASEFFWMHGMILGGLCGTGPWSLDNYFFWHGIPYSGYSSYDALLQDVSEGDIVVFTVMNSASDLSSGFHTMAAQYVGSQFIIYNISNRYTASYPVTTLNPVYDDAVWIYGYIVGG